jgi:signal transduction histidine kinase
MAALTATPRSARWRVVEARLGDLAAASVALVLGGMASDATDVATTSYAEVNELIGLIAIAALWWRRRAPLGVAALTFVAAAAAPLAAGAALVSIYTVAAHNRRRTSAIVVAIYAGYLAAGVVSTLAFPDEDLGNIGSAVAGLVLTVAAFGWGLAVRSRRELMEALAERAARAESDQQARVTEARRAERARIAAEMHDVLAHRLSLLSLHAGAIELRPDARPEDLTAAARVIRSTAHLALEDLRTVIGVLRDDVAGDLAPPPTLADLDALVAECRAAGMSVEVTGELGEFAELAGEVTGGPVPEELGRHAYRVVREGLTNARKHAPGQPVQLVVTGKAGDGLRIEIVNPMPGPDGSAAAEAIPGAGAGLVGLRERVELAGGTLDCTTGAGRHRLSVWLPWAP